MNLSDEDMRGNNQQQLNRDEQRKHDRRMVLESEKAFKNGRNRVPVMFFLVEHHHSDSTEKARNAS